MTLYIGTSGYAYKEWKPDFYPADTPQKSFLEHYARTLSACEINATFYRLQSEQTFAKWASQTPQSFRFSLKAHRGLTHGKSIAPGPESRGLLDTFVKGAAVLGPQLGVILFQFPPYRHRDDAQLESLIDALPAGVRVAFEFRHESWESPEVAAHIADRGGTVCISETKGEVPTALPAGPHAYIRLRTDRYSEEKRSAWLSLLQAEASARDVFCFAKHEGIPAGDPLGGVGLAGWLCEQVAGS
jgi:uncharacterized protein YecE (DUF72 family)